MQQLQNNELRTLCIQMNWFTGGCISQYNRLFDLNQNGASIHDLALIIWLCSEDSSLNTLNLIENSIKIAIKDKMKNCENANEKTKFIVCMNPIYVRDTQVFDTSGISEKEFQNLNSFAENNEDRWRDLEATPFIAIIEAVTEHEACCQAANRFEYDSRCLLANKI